MRKIPVLQVIVFLVGVKIYSLLGPENVVKPFFRESDRCSRLRATRQRLSSSLLGAPRRM